MNKYKAYLNDDYIQIKNKGIIKIKSNAINNGVITNKNKFIDDYKKVIKDKNILSTTITILLNKEINDQDIIYYTNVFEELNYSKIKVISTKEYITNNVLIINDNLYIIYYDNKYHYIYPYLLKEFINKNNIKVLKIIGTNNIKIDDYCKCYYYANSDNYFM